VPGQTPVGLGAYGSEYLDAVWEESWDPGQTSYYPSDGFSPDTLEGIFGGIAKAIGGAAKAVGGAVGTVIKQVPTAVGGFLVGGPAGAVVAVGGRLVSSVTGAPLTEAEAIQYAYLQTQNTPQYEEAYSEFSLRDFAEAQWRVARDAALAKGGELIAGTEAGQEGIRRETTARAMEAIQPFIIPVAVGVGALILFVGRKK